MYGAVPDPHYQAQYRHHPPIVHVPSRHDYLHPPPPPANVLPTLTQAPPSTSSTLNGRTYSLEVVQQPVRARMCGFGDKDRRPITPPPCVRLVVLDAATKKEIDINEIDTSYYVLTVDLWSADGTREVNLVRHSATATTITHAVTSGYPSGPAPPPPPPPPPSASSAAYPPYQPHQMGAYQQPYAAPHPPPPPHPHMQHPNPPPPPPLPIYPPPHLPPGTYYVRPFDPRADAPGAWWQPNPRPPLQPQPSPAPTGMFTRNLIGSLSASAFRLTDPDNKIGVWFILQDLSVRTEGQFRLKMSFVNVGDGNKLNTGSAPVLATTFSDVFQVFSAKKFPGVIESTGLSKCFATQGIKIPIRKDAPKALSGREDYETDD